MQTSTRYSELHQALRTNSDPSVLRQLVKNSRASGVPSIPSHVFDFFQQMESSLTFHQKWMLVGTLALTAYDLLLDTHLSKLRSPSSDLDLAFFPNAFIESPKISLTDSLSELEITPAQNAAVLDSGLTVSFRTKTGLHVDLLTAEELAPEAWTPFIDFRIFPMPRFSLLMHQPIAGLFLTNDKVCEILIPNPVHFAFQKIEMAAQRIGNTAHKTERDLQQATAVLKSMCISNTLMIQEAWEVSKLLPSTFFDTLHRQLQALPDQELHSQLKKIIEY